MSLSHETVLSDAWSHPKLCSNFLLSFFCPCVILGHMRSMVKREETFKLTWIPSISPEEAAIPVPFGLGNSGCIICIETACLASIGWPCSPILALYVFFQRSHLRDVYTRQESKANDGQPHSLRSKVLYDLSDSCCFLPFVTQQHFAFLRKIEDEGILCFDWETEALAVKRMTRIAPVTHSKVVMLIGPTGCGKSDLFRKIIGITSDVQVSALRDAGSIQTGIRCTSVTDSIVNFIEIWDIPTQRLSYPMVRKAISNLCSALFIFDASDLSEDEIITEGVAGSKCRDVNQSFEDMTSLFTEFLDSNKEHLGRSHFAKVCIAARMDLLANPDDFTKKQRIKRYYGASYGNSDEEESVEETEYDIEQLYRSRRRSIEIARKQRSNLEAARLWAAANGLKYFEISSLTSDGLIDLIEYLRSSRLKCEI
jgi:energy-coupling factor transporter ATP-binding protein EcfA2